MNRFVWLLLLCLTAPALLPGQSVYLSKFVEGNPQNPGDRVHRMDIFNPSSEVFTELSGYVIMTRHHIFQLPDQTFLPPLETLRMARNGKGGEVDIAFARLPHWKGREAESEEAGDFVVIFDRDQQVVDAFYVGGQPEVGFLPSEATLTLMGGETASFRVPGAEDPMWRYVRATSDPAFAFFRINERWRVGSRNKNILPAVQYRYLKTSFQDGAVMLKWATAREQDCFRHRIERSTDGTVFTTIAQVDGKVNTEEEAAYTYFDEQVEKNRIYYYRVTNTDKFGHLVESNPSKIRSEEFAGLFSMEVIRSLNPQDGALNVRFASKNDQEVRVQLMDEELREVAILFYGAVQKGIQNYLTYAGSLPIGKYYVIVDTEERRYYEPFVVE